MSTLIKLRNVKTGFTALNEPVAPKNDPNGTKKYIVYLVMDKNDDNYRRVVATMSAMKKELGIKKCNSGLIDYDQEDKQGNIPSDDEPALKGKAGLKVSTKNKILYTYNGEIYDGEIGHGATVDAAIDFFYAERHNIITAGLKVLRIIDKGRVAVVDPFDFDWDDDKPNKSNGDIW